MNLHEAQLRDAAFLCREQTSWLRMIAKFRLEGTLQVSSPTSCSRQGQRCGQTRLLRTLSSWVLKTSWGQGQLSLSGQPALLPGCPHGEKVICRIQSCIQSEPLFFRLMPVVTSLPTLHYREEPAWLHLLNYPSQVGTVGLLLGPPEAVPPHGASAPAPTTLVALHWVCST